MDFLDLVQLNKANNDYGSLLDIVFSNSTYRSVTLSPDSLLPCDKYHPSLLYKMDLYDEGGFAANREEYYYYNFKKASYCSINEYFLKLDWFSLFQPSLAALKNIVFDENQVLLCAHVDDMINILYTHIYSVILLHVPYI